jgi:hypothetical protein
VSKSLALLASWRDFEKKVALVLTLHPGLPSPHQAHYARAKKEEHEIHAGMRHGGKRCLTIGSGSL